MAHDPQCERCGAPLTLPTDFSVWMVRCQYCGHDHELPDHAGRRAYAERQRQDAERAALNQAQVAALGRAPKASSGAGKVVLITLIVVPAIALVVIGVVMAIIGASSSSSAPSTTLKNDPPPALAALAAKAGTEGCPRVVTEPSVQHKTYSSSYGLVKAECARFLAVAVPPAPLVLLVTDPAGAVTRRFAPTGTLDQTVCAKSNADHQVVIQGAPEFWLEARACPRKFADDGSTTGKSRVVAELKQLMSHGCYDISLTPTTVFNNRKLTTPLNAGQCLEVLAATGVEDNAITAKLSTPFGEAVAPLPAPGLDLQIAYCAATSGEHVTELSSAVDGPFTIGIAICNRAALPRVLPKASK